MSSKQELISLIDLTNLNEAELDGTFLPSLCQKAQTPLGTVAAVCVYPRFVKEAAALLKGTPIPVATVVNFPQGNQPLSQVLAEIAYCLEQGAQDIDVVFPYQAFLKGQKEGAGAFVAACKAGCGERLLKVILETGVLQDPQQIAEAAKTVILAGADFVKTSTGKLTPGATLEAAEVILRTILAIKPTVGLKVAGGIREPEEALRYLHLAKKLMGDAWVSPRTFRIGASQLVDKLSG